MSARSRRRAELRDMAADAAMSLLERIDKRAVEAWDGKSPLDYKVDIKIKITEE